MGMNKVTVAVSDEMLKALKVEKEKRLLDSVPETIRMILSDYLSKIPQQSI
jgi:hypothetical protein